MSSFKPVRPESFDGKRDALTVNTWIYQLQVYFNLIEVSDNTVELSDEVKINLASSLMKGNAASWWYMKVHSGNIPQDWTSFKQDLRHEFVPQDQVRRSRDRLRQLQQKGSVSTYLNLFRNIVIGIPNISEDEKLDKFCAGLKTEIRLEVLKAGPSNMDDASRIALNVDSAMYGTGMFSPSRNHSGPTPMDIGNVEGQVNNFQNKKRNGQRQKDIANNACFVCHRKGCRSWKHNPDGSLIVQNIESENRKEENSEN